VSFSHISRWLTEVKWEESKEEMKKMEKKSKHSYGYDLIKREGNSAVMGARKTIAVRVYQLKSGHALIAKYLMRIGKRRDMKCWWCGHEYQTRDHLFKWCKRWKQEQKRLWIDGQEGEDGYKGVEKVLKKPKISLPMSLVFAEEKCSQALMDFLFCTDVGRISRVVDVRGSPLTVIMALVEDLEKHIPCFSPPSYGPGLCSLGGVHDRYGKLCARQLRRCQASREASFTSGYYAGLAQQCTAVNTLYASKWAPNLHLITSGIKARHTPVSRRVST